MPNYKKREKAEPTSKKNQDEESKKDQTFVDDLQASARILNTVQRQIASYQMSLEKLKGLRKECEIDSELDCNLRSSPESMAKVLVDRNIPVHLAIGFAAEDFNDPGFGAILGGGALGFWTWDCCCSDCCITECIGTNFGNRAPERNPVPLEALFGERKDLPK